MKRLFTPGGIIGGIVSLLAFCSSSFAQTEEEKNFLLLYFKEEELVVESATRSLKPVSRTAENITVISTADIELMNAHSVAEVLNTVTGVEVWMTGGPGQIASGYIQGSETRHVTVIIDGVVLNNIGSNVADIGMMPVQNIERIEIIKGPASSAWGSALGGVVNIITKSGTSGNQGGVLSASYGTENSGDFRAEARGKKGKTGYYLAAGRLQSDGLTPNSDVSEHSGYAKLTHELTDDTIILFALGYEKTSRGAGIFTPYFDEFDENTMEILHSTLALNSALTKDVELSVSLRTARQDFNTSTYQLSTGVFLREMTFKDKGYGSSAKLTWKSANQTIVLGADYDDKTLTSNSIAGEEQGIKKWAVFANNTLTFNRLSVTPGIRYDYTNTNGDITSPSLGVTYSLANSTILRASAAKGFSIPTLGETFGDTVFYTANPNLKMETVWSYQVGAETAAMKYIWLKLSAFRNEIRDAITLAPAGPLVTAVNSGRQRRQGATIEMKTSPVYNISLSAGAEYIDAKDLDTGMRIQNVPANVYDLGLRYDDGNSFRALLQGRHIDWNADPSWMGDYSSFIFDLSVIMKIYGHRDASLEAFANAHNIFNGAQYPSDFYKNPGRWYEGGIRYKF